MKANRRIPPAPPWIVGTSLMGLLKVLPLKVLPLTVLALSVVTPSVVRADEPTLGSLFSDLKNIGRPSVTVKFDQPPKHWLQVERVAFVESKGPCVAEIESLLKQHFVDQGVTVVDRGQLETVLQEHGLIRARLVEPQTAIELGKMLGATTLIRLDVQRCEDAYDIESVGQSRYVTTFTDVKGAIEIIDIETTRVFSTQVFDGRAESRKRVEGYRVDNAEKAPVHDEAIERAAVSALGLLLPWPDEYRVFLYDTKRCGLKGVTRRFAIGDFETAHRLARQAAEECADGKKDLKARTQFVLGYSLLALGQTRAAVDVLEEAYLLDPGRQMLEGLNQARQILEAKEKLQGYQEFLETSGSTARARLVAEALFPPSDPEEEPAEESVRERLEKLKALYEDDLISKEDYERRRAEILADL